MMATPASPHSDGPVELYASVGQRLARYLVDADDGKLREDAALELPESVQYAVHDRARGLLYVACSNGSPGAPGDRHWIVAVRLAQRPALEGAPVPLPSRPIHLSLDGSGRRLLVAYNQAPGLSLHAVAADGSVSQALAAGLPEGAHYAHQVVPMPDGRHVVVVCRGADAHGAAPELPGSLQVLSLEGDAIRAVQAVTPAGGYGFGPRNIVFNAAGTRAYVSVERQNRLVVYALENGRFGAEPISMQSTLRGLPSYAPQIAGALRLHPNGQFLYVANRTHRTTGGDRCPDVGPGENSIAVYRLDQNSGVPVPLQTIGTEGVHPRTLSLDDAGRLLVAANLRAASFDGPTGVRQAQAGFAVFRVERDGRLTLLNRHPVSTDHRLLFWSAILGRDAAVAGHTD